MSDTLAVIGRGTWDPKTILIMLAVVVVFLVARSIFKGKK